MNKLKFYINHWKVKCNHVLRKFFIFSIPYMPMGRRYCCLWISASVGWQKKVVSIQPADMSVISAKKYGQCRSPRIHHLNKTTMLGWSYITHQPPHASRRWQESPLERSGKDLFQISYLEANPKPTHQNSLKTSPRSRLDRADGEDGGGDAPLEEEDLRRRPMRLRLSFLANWK